MGLDFGQAVAAASGIVGARWITGQVAQYVPPQLSSGPGRLLLTSGVAAAASMLARRFNRGIGNAIAVGGAIAVVLDALEMYVLPMLPALGPASPASINGYSYSSALSPGYVGMDGYSQEVVRTGLTGSPYPDPYSGSPY